MNILGICLLLLQVQVQPAAISGMITRPGGAEPLPKATVSLVPVAPGEFARIRSTVTEEDGRFTFGDIEPGDYQLSVRSERYGQAAYGQRKPGGPGSILTITAGQQVPDLRISTIPTGTIAGRITGRNGEPLVYATVQAVKYAYRDGKKALTVAQATATDDRGEYRLFWLPPGQYFVVAATGRAPIGPAVVQPVRPGGSAPSPQDGLAIEQAVQLAELMRAESFPTGGTTIRILEDGTVQEEAWAPVYYPATTEPRLATALDVVAGTARTGIDIIIGPSRVQKVRGRVLGFTPGSTPTVTLVPEETAGGARTPIIGKGGSSVDGAFEFTGVMPGTYYVVASDLRSGLFGTPLLIQVGNSDVENLTLAVTQALSVSGRVLLEGVTQNTGDVDPFRRITVRLQRDVPGNSLGGIASQPATGTGAFVWNNVGPGDYRIQISSGGPVGSTPLPFYLKSARLGLTDVTEGIRIAGGINDRIEIVLTTESGSVEGVAIGSRGGPAANTTVVLVPNTGRKRSDLYKSVVTGTDGRFRFQYVTPGDYKLFAWDDVETGAWQDSDFIRVYESKGLPVHAGEKSKEEVQVNVIYNP